MQKLKEQGYKIVSASAVTLDTLAKPAVKHSHNLMLEGSSQIESSVNHALETIETSTPESLGWVIFM